MEWISTHREAFRNGQSATPEQILILHLYEVHDAFFIALRMLTRQFGNRNTSFHVGTLLSCSLSNNCIEGIADTSCFYSTLQLVNSVYARFSPKTCYVCGTLRNQN